MTFRNIFVAGAAGLLMGVSSGPQVADAAPTFPVTIDFNYCWGSTSCGHTYVDAYVLQQTGSNPPSGTWTTYSNFTGTWNWNRSTKTVTLAFDNPGTVYYGVHLGKGLLEGPMEAPQYTNYGAWAGQVRL